MKSFICHSSRKKIHSHINMSPLLEYNLLSLFNYTTFGIRWHRLSGVELVSLKIFKCSGFKNIIILQSRNKTEIFPTWLVWFCCHRTGREKGKVLSLMSSLLVAVLAYRKFRMRHEFMTQVSPPTQIRDVSRNTDQDKNRSKNMRLLNVCQWICLRISHNTISDRRNFGAN